MTTLLLLAIALAMDAFAVSLAKGCATRPGVGGAARIALAFGVAQAVMPLLGWALGTVFARWIEAIDHWVAFVLLGAIGLKMIKEGLEGDDAVAPGECAPAARLSDKALLMAAIATSIDAAAAGVTLPTLGQPVALAVITIGLVTAILCFFGALLGARIGVRIGKLAEIGGGVVLIALGARILAQHSGWIG